VIAITIKFFALLIQFGVAGRNIFDSPYYTRCPELEGFHLTPVEKCPSYYNLYI
jgi:hypothetical protein